MINYFQTFSLPTTFSLNLENLENKYLELQQKYHPDINININQNFSAELNEAYQTLKDPLSRATYLIKINFDINLKEDNSSKINSSILLQIMELSEQIAENKNNPQKIIKIYQQIESDIADLFIEFEKNIKDKNQQKSIENVTKIKYLKNLINHNVN